MDVTVGIAVRKPRRGGYRDTTRVQTAEPACKCWRYVNAQSVQRRMDEYNTHDDYFCPRDRTGRFHVLTAARGNASRLIRRTIVEIKRRGNSRITFATFRVFAFRPRRTRVPLISRDGYRICIFRKRRKRSLSLSLSLLGARPRARCKIAESSMRRLDLLEIETEGLLAFRIFVYFSLL